MIHSERLCGYCASYWKISTCKSDHPKIMKVDPRRLIPRKLVANLELLMVSINQSLAQSQPGLNLKRISLSNQKLRVLFVARLDPWTAWNCRFETVTSLCKLWYNKEITSAFCQFLLKHNWRVNNNKQHNKNNVRYNTKFKSLRESLVEETHWPSEALLAIVKRWI